MTSQQILQKYWGYEKLYPLQKRAIDALLDQKNTLVLLPTGGGKSICFQVTALQTEGICLVISPLISLMKDQVQQLLNQNISATALHSGLSPREIDELLDACIEGEYKFLYIAPERIKSKVLIARLKQMKINVVAVDEAHCISEWGYDFRPSYLEIPTLLNYIPKNVPWIALTATATHKVQKDIAEKLQFRNYELIVDSFERKNISYSCWVSEDKLKSIFQILQKPQKSVIIYTRSRKKTESIGEYLQNKGLKTQIYHAGLSYLQRTKAQEKWISDESPIMVATSAFGMGINKPNVSCVIHVDLPETMEAYYQETGRAGRDGSPSEAVLFYHPKDIELSTKLFEQQFPPIEELIKHYDYLGNYYQIPVGSGEGDSYDFDIQHFCETFGLYSPTLFRELKVMEKVGVLQLSEAFLQHSQIQMEVSYEKLYDFQLRNPSLEPFLQCILRLYGGQIFQQRATISESKIAQMYGATTSEVEKKIENMAQQQILSYWKQKNKPQLTFSLPRQSEKFWYDKSVQLNDRKNTETVQHQGFIQYVTQKTLCRNRFILLYFGENKDKDCGHCDICLSKKQHNPRNLDQQILEIITSHQPISLQKLVSFFLSISENDLHESLRNLIEDRKIKYDKNAFRR